MLSCQIKVVVFQKAEKKMIKQMMNILIANQEKG
jgi:hypothetical protein